VNATINRKTTYLDLGLCDYKEAWDYQTELFQQILSVKSGNRDAAVSDQLPTPNYLLFCEHPHVYTLGKSGSASNLLLNEEQLAANDATYYHINRGGDITYHGPGQIVVYPIIDLENFFTDIHQYMRLLEESVIRTCAALGIETGRIPGLTGVWVDFQDERTARKISALGVKTSRWVTMHGLAFNVNADLAYFKNIIPCGIDDKAVTSVEKELGRKQDMKAVSLLLRQNIVELFTMELL
jgi:lipoyl(octanoyl) transferase